LKDFYKDLIDENSDMKSFLWAHTIDPEMADYLNETFLPTRRQKNIKAKVILCNTEENRKYYWWLQKKYMINDQWLTEVKIVDHEIFKLYNQIDIYGEQKISFVSYSPDNMFAVVVESAFLHDSLVSIFDLVRKIG
jgi:hypothetical protein